MNEGMHKESVDPSALIVGEIEQGFEANYKDYILSEYCKEARREDMEVMPRYIKEMKEMLEFSIKYQKDVQTYLEGEAKEKSAKAVESMTAAEGLVCRLSEQIKTVLLLIQ